MTTQDRIDNLIPDPRETAKSIHRKWEYKTVWDNFQLNDNELNKLGAEGWELIAFNKASSQIWSSGWTFKRRAASNPTRQDSTTAQP